MERGEEVLCCESAFAEYERWFSRFWKRRVAILLVGAVRALLHATTLYTLVF